MGADCCKEISLPADVVKSLKWILYIVFFINAGMFFVEFISGMLAHSNALVADSLDMLGDAFVYGLSLFVLSRSNATQAKASLVKGIIMLLLGLYVFWEVLQKIVSPTLPTGEIMTIIGILALIANISCFLLLNRHKEKNLNMRSSWICSRNDLYGNVGVILAGFLVGYFNSMWPDIIVGLGIASLIVYFSAQVIRESLVQAHDVRLR